MTPQWMERVTQLAIPAAYLIACLAAGVGFPSPAAAQDAKPNILVIWGDDIGQSNISAYTFGMMGYQTPNIDRIADEGMMFTDYYGEQSCTAGRSSFITGQSVFRTGLSKVGLPGAELGMREEDPTIAGMLKAQGYATGQFGKNHLGDRDEHLPTNHGFDVFFGNLYHLNAEEEPENEDYPRDMALPDGQTFLERFGPRGVLRSTATYGEAGITQEIEDTGPLTRARMEVVDDETSDAAIEFIREQNEAGTPWFVWWNGTRMHFRTHVAPEMRERANEIAGHPVDEYTAGMIEHDMDVGKFLDVLDELGIADNTIVFYSTDNGPHMNTWPDAAMTPFWSEKNTNWEGGWRVPAMVCWPGHIKPRTVTNEIGRPSCRLTSVRVVARWSDEMTGPYERDWEESGMYLDRRRDRVGRDPALCDHSNGAGPFPDPPAGRRGDMDRSRNRRGEPGCPEDRAAGLRRRGAGGGQGARSLRCRGYAGDGAGHRGRPRRSRARRQPHRTGRPRGGRRRWRRGAADLPRLVRSSDRKGRDRR
jgi:hypothetical protein